MQDRLQVFPGMDIDFQHHGLLDEAFIKPLFLVGVAVGGRGFSWYTLPETNILAPENRLYRKLISFCGPIAPFAGANLLYFQDRVHPQKLTRNPKKLVLSRCFSFSRGVFLGSSR